MAGPDWIHTLTSIARGLKSLTAELKRYNDAQEAGLKQEIQAAREESLAELEELGEEIKAVKRNGLPTPEHPDGIHLMGVSGKTYEGGCDCATCRLRRSLKDYLLPGGVGVPWTDCGTCHGQGELVCGPCPCVDQEGHNTPAQPVEVEDLGNALNAMLDNPPSTKETW